MAYTRKDWVTGDIVSAVALNNIEDGLKELRDSIDLLNSGGVDTSLIEQVIREYIETNGVADANTTYTFTWDGNSLKITPSDGTQATYTMPTATKSKAGAMSAEDKTKLEALHDDYSSALGVMGLG